MSFTRKKRNGQVTPKAKRDKMDHVTKEEAYRPRDGTKQKYAGSLELGARYCIF